MCSKISVNVELKTKGVIFRSRPQGSLPSKVVSAGFCCRLPRQIALSLLVFFWMAISYEFWYVYTDWYKNPEKNTEEITEESENTEDNTEKN